ncbi:unnamed protein product, partial [Trichobilharzia regenti]
GIPHPANLSRIKLCGLNDPIHPIGYRNFRTFTVPTRRIQFSSLAVDTRGSLVAAGGLDTFEAYVWSIKTGQLLATLTGHTAPITDENNLSSMEVVNFSCDGKFSVFSQGVEMGTIDGHRDLGVSQTSENDLVTPQRAAEAKKFQSIAYSVDGEHLLAGGDSKYVCLYSIPDKMLLKRFEVTCNLSLEGVQEVHDRRKYLSHFSMETINSKEAQRPSLRIPSTVKGGEQSRRQWRPEVRVSAVGFSPTGNSLVYVMHSFKITSSILLSQYADHHRRGDLKEVTSFTYHLGSIIGPFTGVTDEDVKSRIGKARNTLFINLKPIWKTNLRYSASTTKLGRIFNTDVKSVSSSIQIRNLAGGL